MYSSIVATGSFVPAKRESNSALEDHLGLEHGWISRRTGVEARAIAADHHAVSDLAIRAGEVALQDLSTKCSEAHPEVSILILATSTPDQLLPPTSAAVASKLGLQDAAAFDLTVACSGFLYAMILADSLVRAQGASVLVIAANILSRRCNPDDSRTRPIFADAAGAVVMSPGKENQLAPCFAWQSDGSKASCLFIPDGGSKTPFNGDTYANKNHFMTLADGNAVFRYAVEKMAELGEQVVRQAGLQMSDVDWWIPHQANSRIIDGAARILKMPPSKTLTTLKDYGNSSAATIPVTLHHYLAINPTIKPGDRILMTTAAAGATCAAGLISIPPVDG